MCGLLGKCVFENVHGAFDDVARHYKHAMVVIVILTCMGCTYASQQNVTALWDWYSTYMFIR